MSLNADRPAVGTQNVLVTLDPEFLSEFTETEDINEVDTLLRDGARGLTDSFVFSPRNSNFVSINHEYNYGTTSKATGLETKIKLEILDPDLEFLSVFTDQGLTGTLSDLASMKNPDNAEALAGGAVQELHDRKLEEIMLRTRTPEQLAADPFWLKHMDITSVGHPRRQKAKEALRRIGSTPFPKVYIMYGTGSDPRHWAGPFECYLGDINYNYDGRSAETTEYSFFQNIFYHSRDKAKPKVETSATKIKAKTIKIPLFAFDYNPKIPNTSSRTNQGLIQKKYQNTSSIHRNILYLYSKYLGEICNIKNHLLILPDLDNLFGSQLALLERIIDDNLQPTGGRQLGSEPYQAIYSPISLHDGQSNVGGVGHLLPDDFDLTNYSFHNSDSTKTRIAVIMTAFDKFFEHTGLSTIISRNEEGATLSKAGDPDETVDLVDNYGSQADNALNSDVKKYIQPDSTGSNPIIGDEIHLNLRIEEKLDVEDPLVGFNYPINAGKTEYSSWFRDDDEYYDLIRQRKFDEAENRVYVGGKADVVISLELNLDPWIEEINDGDIFAPIQAFVDNVKNKAKQKLLFFTYFWENNVIINKELKENLTSTYNIVFPGHSGSARAAAEAGTLILGDEELINLYIYGNISLSQPGDPTPQELINHQYFPKPKTFDPVFNTIRKSVIAGAGLNWMDRIFNAVYAKKRHDGYFGKRVDDDDIDPHIMPDEFSMFTDEQKNLAYKLAIPIFKSGTSDPNVLSLRFNSNDLFFAMFMSSFQEAKRGYAELIGLPIAHSLLTGSHIETLEDHPSSDDLTRFIFKTLEHYKNSWPNMHVARAVTPGYTGEPNMAQFATVIKDVMAKDSNQGLTFFTEKYRSPNSLHFLYTFFELMNTRFLGRMKTLPMFHLSHANIHLNPAILLVNKAKAMYPGDDFESRTQVEDKRIYNHFYTGVYRLIGFKHVLSQKDAYSEFLVIKDLMSTFAEDQSIQRI